MAPPHAAILQTIFDHISVMINFVSADGRILFVNRAWESTLGWSTEDVRSGKLDVLRACYPVAADYERVRRFLAAATGEWSDFRTRVRSGRTIDTTWCALRLSDDTTIGVGMDSSRGKGTEEAFRTSREQMRALAAYLQTVREEERARIARELHDDLGQLLTGLRFDLSWLATRLSGTPLRADEVVLERVREMNGRVDEILQSVRRIATELQPSVLEDFGLPAALEWQVESFQARTGIRCDAVIGPNLPRLRTALATGVFRIVQEALTNAARHAQPRHVRIGLRTEGDVLVVEVGDDGRGITDAERAGFGSLGLLGMHERARRLGGELLVQGLPGRGTTVAARLPLDRPEAMP
jgi:PAS domain S-box-containing protein